MKVAERQEGIPQHSTAKAIAVHFSIVKKSEALKTYCSKHKLRGGFVCYDESEDDLLLSEDGFSDDISAECWKSLNDVVAKS